ncbi:hypothetical protein [Agromyces neolithicus]|uniref:Abi family protein n=1 Tax=Agromyces neolithicus TaxID=269420 RepID=A0ABP4YHT7_9MICO
MSTESSEFDPRKYDELLPLVTGERLGSYLRASGGGVVDAFHLYEWNMHTSASVMELTSMVEVLVRNALDHELREWAHARRGGASWLDAAPLDQHGREDIRKARARATRRGKRAEVHGRVIAELPLGFWRYLVESRYLTALWIPATQAAFPNGARDLRTRQKEVAFQLQQLNFVRNRAAHHEPIHQRDLARDLGSALDLAGWISDAAREWVAAKTTLPRLIEEKPRRSE